MKIIRQLLRLIAENIVGLNNADALDIVQHRLRQIFTLLLPFGGIGKRFLFHALRDQQYDCENGKSGQTQPPVQRKQENKHDRFGKNLAHGTGYGRHAVFLDKHHICGKNRTDFADIALCKVAHWHSTQMLAELHPFIRKQLEPCRSLKPIGDNIKNCLQRNAHNENDTDLQAECSAHGVIQKGINGDKRQPYRRFHQQCFQKGEDKGDGNPLFVFSGCIENPFE